MQTARLHDDRFFEILWDEKTEIIGIHWKGATLSMTEQEFKSELERFAGYVEAERARGILVDVAHFRHKMAPGVQEWRVKNISTRYNAAGRKCRRTLRFDLR